MRYTLAVARTRVLLVGRAGSGKTRAVLERFALGLEHAGEQEPLLLLPTVSQANHLKRLLLSRAESVRGLLDRGVLTFTSLAERVLRHRPIGELLSGLRQDLLLRGALRDAAPPAFRALARFAGFRRALLAFVKELKQNGLPPAELLAELGEFALTRSGPTRRRLEALRDVLAAYEHRRERAGALDHEDYLREARDRLREDPEVLRGVSLGVDGFTNFTRLEREILLLLSDRRQECTVTLPGEPRPGQAAPQFRVSEETQAFLEAHGFVVRALVGNRRAATECLRRLEAGLFGDGGPAAAADGSVRILEGADPEDEADRVARTARRLAVEEGRRWREMLVVARDARQAGPRFRKAFARHGVPLRVFAGEDAAAEPVIRDALALLSFAAAAPGPADLLGLLRSGRLRGAGPGDADLLEDRLREFGPPADPAAWAALIPALAPAVATALAGEAGAPADLARAAEGIVAGGIEPRFALRGATLPAPGSVEADRWRREAHALRVLRETLAETARALAEEGGTVTPARFLAELREGLSLAALPPADRRLMVVNLVDAREARQWEAPIVFVTGLLEGEFPQRPREDVFLPDEDRGEANRDGRLNLRERLLLRDEERYLFYVALTRASARLHLSYPVTDGRGEPTLPALPLEEVAALVAGPGLRSPRRLSETLPRADEITGPEDLRRMALLMLSDPPRGGEGEGRAEGVAAALHERLSGDERYARALRTVLRFRRPPPALLADPSPLATPRVRSATSLEDFAQCPFLHFARHALRLRSPAAGGEDLDRRALGDIAHEVLARALSPVTAGGAPLDPRPLLEEVFARRTAGLRLDLAAALARREMEEVLVRTVDAEVARWREDGYVPALLEWDFEGLAIARPEGGAVRLAGRIDRVDEGPAGAVVLDYKYSARGFDSDRQRALSEGAHFQLPVYLLAVQQVLGRRPAGAFLCPLLTGERTGIEVEGGGEGTRRGVRLAGGELPGFLEEARARIRETDARIRTGDVAWRPRDRARCADCDFADLCRIEPWLSGQEDV